MVSRAEYWAKEHHTKAVKVEQHFSKEFQEYAYKNYFNVMQSYKTEGRILDIGCGIGSFVFAASRRGWDAFGNDIGPSITIAQGYGLQVFRGSLEAQEFQDNYFDVITMLDVIEHVVDLDRLMLLIKKKLRSGGLLIIKTPNLHCVNSLFLGKNWSAVQPFDHLYLFTKKTLSSLLSSYQFQIAIKRTQDINVFELLRSKNINNGLELKEKPKRTLIGKVLRSKLLQNLRNMVNFVFNLLGLGESLVFFSVNYKDG
jgi:2-polyprenyl-3-methyl-5-hydroxy-6-metoxy-1,4-benzoquinol methylase